MKVAIKFNKNFYNLEAVKKSAAAFKKLANFRVKEKKNFIEVEIENVDKNFKDVLGDEFSNYVLAETKNVSQS